ncbi:MAG: DUF2283 domain-containing protein [Chloroflexi bacterium]|nr:DUF2283 domain-containing protein [Chloroflexota bacterium]MDA1219217.1 DUF2283 domain-containing protein [Chloroflexota bacterium]
MKLRYSRDVDILLMWLSEEPSDYAEEANGVITHFTRDGKPVSPVSPVSIEIQGGREFILGSITRLVKDEEVGV